MNTSPTSDGDWLPALRRYAMFIAIANLIWEASHLPLYTIWSEGKPREIAFAVAHCTGGDLLIAIGCLILALILIGAPSWPAARFVPVMAVAVTFGLTYTGYSEWLNVEVRSSWAYSDAMPVVPPFGTGLSPLLQWLVLPPLGLLWARRARCLG